MVGRRAYVCDVVGNLTFGARCEQYVENEEWAPAENEREKHESQDLLDICDWVTSLSFWFIYLRCFLLGGDRVCWKVCALSLVEKAQLEVERRRGHVVEVDFERAQLVASSLSLDVLGCLRWLVVSLPTTTSWRWREQCASAAAVVIIKVQQGMWRACANVVWSAIAKVFNSISFQSPSHPPLSLQNATAGPPAHRVLRLGMWKIFTVVVVANFFDASLPLVIIRWRRLLRRVPAAAEPAKRIMEISATPDN